MESVMNSETSVISSTPIKCSPNSHNAFKTPSGPITNPFESPWKEMLHMPSTSPSTFLHVISPSDKIDDKFEWTIDQKAEIDPVEIEIHGHQFETDITDHETEKKLQETIDRYFLEHIIVPSPWSSSGSKSKSNDNYSPALTSSFHRKSFKKIISCKRNLREASTQTVLSLPLELPKELEDMLSKYLNLEEGVAQCYQEIDESQDININNSLRRKLFEAEHSCDDIPTDLICDLSVSPVTEGLEKRRASGVTCSSSPTLSPIREDNFSDSSDCEHTELSMCDYRGILSGDEKVPLMTQSILMPFDNFESNIQDFSMQACSTRLQISNTHSSGFYSMNEIGGLTSENSNMIYQKAAQHRMNSLPEMENPAAETSSNCLNKYR